MQHIAAKSTGRGEITPRAGAAADRAAPDVTVAPATLSPRQLETLALIASGATDKQAGRLLKISVFTVGHHLARVRERLGATHNAHAVAIAIRLGIIDP
jgi:DNA-binding CsgD family transcriptional regulator